MGKGRGAEKTSFQRFLDESYFSFVFLNWALALGISGIALIIIGAVVNAVYPTQTINGINNSQYLSSDATSTNYLAWSQITELDTYQFSNVNVNNSNNHISISCNQVGPYVYSTELTKADITFGDGSATYQITKAKVFDIADSTSTAKVTAFSPAYAELVYAVGSEEAIFSTLAAQNNITTGINNFFTSTAPILIGSKAIYDGLQADFSETPGGVLNKIYNDLLADNLNQAISTYGNSYTNFLINNYFVYNSTSFACTPASTCKGGVYNHVYNLFTSAACNPDTLTDFDNEMASGFTGLPTSPCQAFLSNQSFSSGGFTAQQVAAVFSDFKTTLVGAIYDGGLYNFYTTQSNGKCDSVALRTAAANAYSPVISLDQMNWICDTYIPQWYSYAIEQLAVAAVQSLNVTDLGYYKFCVGELTSAAQHAQGVYDVFFYPSSVPLPLSFDNLVLYGTATGYDISPFVSSFQLLQQSQASFNLAECKTIVQELTQTDYAFNLTVLGNVPNSVAGTSFSGADAVTYFQTFGGFISAYYVYGLVYNTAQFSSYSFSISPATSALATSAADLTNVQNNLLPLTVFFFPSVLSYVASLSYITADFAVNPFTNSAGVNVTNKVVGTSQVYEPITAINGLAGLLLNLNTNADLETWQAYNLLDAASYGSLQLWINNAISSWSSSLGAGSADDLGYYQFTYGNLTGAGCNPPSLSCSVANVFFGQDNNYGPEYAMGAYNGPYYLGLISFVPNPASNVGALTPSTAQTLLNNLATNCYNTVLSGVSYEKVYIYYLFNTYVLAAVGGSTTGLFPTRNFDDFIHGFSDPIVAAYLAVTSVPAVSATYAIDADGTSASTFTIYTGSQNVSASYEFASINGTAAVNYWPQVLDVSFLLNTEQFPPGVFSGTPTVDTPTLATVLDVDLLRTFVWTFNGTTSSTGGLNGYLGYVDANQWKANAAFNVSQDYQQPINPWTSNQFYGPCSQALASSSCPITPAANQLDGLIVVHPDTGLVLSYETCKTLYVSPKSTFQVTQPHIDTTYIFTQVQKATNRTIDPNIASSLANQYNSAKSTGQIILGIFVAVGCLLLVGGIVFLTFYILKLQREDHHKAESELVSDPFHEKGDRFGNTGF